MRKKGISEKERTSHWLKTIETVKRIDRKLGQNYYYLEGDNSKGYLRHELSNVQLGYHQNLNFNAQTRLTAMSNAKQ